MLSVDNPYVRRVGGRHTLNVVLGVGVRGLIIMHHLNDLEQVFFAQTL